ncbi:MAG: serine--tRNA ligase [Candidatus Meridianibacter frigidus]|nr:MAG: serine--tRNA ligase [Candidatus Eremiobacteraeota bacterium]
MLDIALIRRDPDRVRRSLRRRGIDSAIVADLLRLDAEFRNALGELERLQSQRNALSAQIGRAADKAAAADEHRNALDALKAQIESAQTMVAATGPDASASPLAEVLQNIPNLLDDAVPDGASAADNAVLRTWGAPPAFDFSPKPHWEIGTSLGILDFERAVKLSGSRFSILSGAGARLSRALATFFLERAARNEYTEVAPPYLVTRDTMWSTGQLTKFSDQMFFDQAADLFMIPTSEVPLTALRADEVLDFGELPKRYTAYSPCFRKEAGAAGKDTRGLMRQHQFEKVELVWLTAPEGSDAALERLVADAESLLQELGLPYRAVALCGTDVGFNAAKTIDLEVWLPSQGVYREISSCSNCTDFQARRANIRFRRDTKGKLEFVHTLNGSALAIGRTLVAILENCQQADGSVRIPSALVPHFGADRIVRS